MSAKPDREPIRKPVRAAAATTTAATASPSSKPTRKPESAMVADIKAIRARTRRPIEDGAITDSYTADRGTVIKLLNQALATEIVCALRYRRYYFMASGLIADAVKGEFLERANEEQATPTVSPSASSSSAANPI